MAGLPIGRLWDGFAVPEKDTLPMKSLMKFVDLLYGWFLSVLSWLQGPFLLVIRFIWGFQFLEDGLGKLTHMSHTVEYFTELGIPNPSLAAHFTASLEAVGGALLILGLGSRLISAPLAVNMTVAFITAEHDKFVSLFSDSATFFAADAFPFLAVALLVLLFGPGWFSLDTVIAEYRKGTLARTSKAKLFLLFAVLFLVIYGASYITIRSDGSTIYDLLRWWRLLIAIVVACGLAELATRIVMKDMGGNRDNPPAGNSKISNAAE